MENQTREERYDKGGMTPGIEPGHDRPHSSLKEAPQWLCDLSDAQDCYRTTLGLVPNEMFPKNGGSFRCYDIVDISYDGELEDGDAYEGGVIARGRTPAEAVLRAIEKLRDGRPLPTSGK